MLEEQLKTKHVGLYFLFFLIIVFEWDYVSVFYESELYQNVPSD